MSASERCSLRLSARCTRMARGADSRMKLSRYGKLRSWVTSGEVTSGERCRIRWRSRLPHFQFWSCHFSGSSTQFQPHFIHHHLFLSPPSPRSAHFRLSQNLPPFVTSAAFVSPSAAALLAPARSRPSNTANMANMQIQRPLAITTTAIAQKQSQEVVQMMVHGGVSFTSSSLLISLTDIVLVEQPFLPSVSVCCADHPAIH